MAAYHCVPQKAVAFNRTISILMLHINAHESPRTCSRLLSRVSVFSHPKSSTDLSSCGESSRGKVWRFPLRCHRHWPHLHRTEMGHAGEGFAGERVPVTTTMTTTVLLLLPPLLTYHDCCRCCCRLFVLLGRLHSCCYCASASASSFWCCLGKETYAPIVDVRPLCHSY